MIKVDRQQLSLLATTYRPECTTVIDKYLDGYYTIQYMERGGVWVAYDNREYTLEGKWFWPAYPGHRIRFHAAPGHDNWFHRHIGFQGPLVQKWIAAGIWPWEPQPEPAYRQYARLFDEIISLTRRTDDWAWLRAVNALEQLLIELAEARATSPAADPWVDKVTAVLAEEHNFVPDYSRVAESFGMGLSTFRRRFREHAGMPVHQWVMQSRMAEAQLLLSETDMPIGEVAGKLGYENVYFFSRQFREHCGVPPSVYRSSRQFAIERRGR